MTWAAPLGEIKSEGAWAHPILKFGARYPPERGHRSFFGSVADDWKVSTEKFARYRDSMRSRRNLCNVVGFKTPSGHCAQRGIGPQPARPS